jgi:hypothetical protein
VLDEQFDAGAVWVVNKERGPVAAGDRTAGDLDPRLAQRRNDLLDRRGLHFEAEMVEPLRPVRSHCGRITKHFEFLIGDFEDCRTAWPPRQAYQLNPECLVKPQAAV